jgi:hypothetical protein
MIFAETCTFDVEEYGGDDDDCSFDVHRHGYLQAQHHC